MAEVTSLGVHTPVALPYLVAEGLLPADASDNLYQWQTYTSNEGNGDIEEEVVATKRCVVWSHGKIIRNVYRFDLEGEDVRQAVLTRFPSKSSTSTSGDRTNFPHDSGIDRGYGKSGRRDTSALHALTTSLGRALVVFLKTKAHIYFLHGSHHVLDLPFEIARAFAAPNGLVLQRKDATPPSLPPTPRMPAPPPNSFWSSQIRPSSSYLQSPTLAKSFGGSQPLKPSPLGGISRLDGLFDSIFGRTNSLADGDIASIFSLTAPLSDLGVVTFSLQHHRPRVSSKSPSGLSVEFEALDASEELVYVSDRDEVALDGQTKEGPLILLVTRNIETRTLTVWHAWYIDERSLASLLKQKAAQKAAKAKRRSSFMSVNAATGATTPAVRAREGARESFAAGGPTRAAGDAAGSRKQTRQEQEDEMAHQMDPDFQPTASQQTVRESRRISSLNADNRGGQHGTASFASQGGRRNTSFGGPGDRKSFGHRKSRGTTPGSVYSRSLGPEDDLMELDSSFDVDNDENIDAILCHIRATHDAAAADGVFGGIDEDYKRELVIQKIHSIALSLAVPAERESSPVQVVTLRDLGPPRTSDLRARVGVYIHDGASKELTCLQLNVRQRTLWPKLQDAKYVAIPTLSSEMKLGKYDSITKLKDGRFEAVLSNAGLFLSTQMETPCPVRTGASYRARDRLNSSSASLMTEAGIGKNRTLDAPERPGLSLRNLGVPGHYDEVGADGHHHRRRLKLSPDNPSVERLLQICRLALPSSQAEMFHGVWLLAHATLVQHPHLMSTTGVDVEWVAFSTAIFCVVGHLISEKERASLNLARVATAQKATSKSSAYLRHQQLFSQQAAAEPWRILHGLQRSSDAALVPDGSSKSQQDQQDHFLSISAEIADELIQTVPWLQSAGSLGLSATEAAKLMLALHVFNEEQKLFLISSSGRQSDALTPLTAQLGGLLGLTTWSFEDGQYFNLEGASESRWVFIKSSANHPPQVPLMDDPISVFMWFEHAMKYRSTERYPSLADVVGTGLRAPLTKDHVAEAARLSPRICSLSDVLTATSSFTVSAEQTLELMAQHGMVADTLETLPEAIGTPFKEAIARCERQPPTAWSSELLRLVGRDDIDLDSERSNARTLTARPQTNASSGTRDVNEMCSAIDLPTHSAKTKEASRHAVSQLIFSEDRRLVEATGLMHYNSPQVAECPKQPDWTDAYHFEQQRRVLQWVTTRMIALPSGDGMLHFDSQTPLLTEKYHLSGFSNACVMQPMGHTLTADRSGLTEEKVNWAYFHAGVSAGLRISKNAKGIDTSWIAFNKPNELTNRHAGLLLALGMRGHLRHLAKWLSFKYLTPKHTVTSVGLLLGLSASYMGTMDGLITRMLSVHITRMLPPGAAELNVSPITQTAGLMGIGLLYYNTQHRRMSEIMLSEVEHMELEDPDSGPDPLRDESYRLAAGFALGFINLGKGRDLRGLSGMHLPERLLAIAVGSRPVSAVHVFDRATAGAIMGIAMVYMKSGDRSIARKIDIPDTEAQFDHVRPDMLMLRAMAKHIILWDGIILTEPASGQPSFVQDNLPPCYQNRFKTARPSLKSSDVPFFNIVTGLVLALSLKYAGSGDEVARDEILAVLDYFYRAKGGSEASFYYDAKLTRATVRRCIDVVALAAATVMAGTGDLKTFRYLRRLHGRPDAETPYGSHFAAHLAIGVLFLAGGTYTFGTSNLAVASLLCAFYPLFPTDVHDNHVHLQAFRHIWVFAAEARCLVIEDIDTQRPITMPIEVAMKDGSIKKLTSPCLLPELDMIASIHTGDPAYWRVTLDFANNPKHLAHFRETQRILVRRCPPSEAHNTTFTATMAALNDTQLSTQAAATFSAWQSVFNLPSFRDIDKAEIELILPPNPQSSVNTDEHGTCVDDRLALAQAAGGADRDALWNLRMLFAWAEKAREDGDGGIRWIGDEVLEGLRARVEERMQGSGNLIE